MNSEFLHSERISKTDSIEFHFASVLIHYSEIALKGRKRAFFERKLETNLQNTTAGKGLVKRLDSRYLVVPKVASDFPFVFEKVGKVLGVQSYCKSYVCDREISSIKGKALELVKQELDTQNNTAVGVKAVLPGVKSVKVEARRADKTYEMKSAEVEREVGDHLRNALPIRFSMKNPDIKVSIEILRDKAYLYTEKHRGFGGLPVGSEGKVLCLLSGGIDSPVASWLMMKRGCDTDFVHFHPFSDNFLDINKEVTDASALEERFSKIFKLVRILCEYCFEAKLHLIPFFPFQMRILKGTGRAREEYERYELLLFRRFMNKVGFEIAKRTRIPALVTGDNLGQVASQTLHNLVATDSADIPVFRPLLGYNKQEISDLARRIGTYETSILPYKDCCSIVSKHPVTSARKAEIEEIEKEIEIHEAVAETLANSITVSVTKTKSVKTNESVNHSGQYIEVETR
jgi:thiamine biosynthesis protein ThiI